MNKILLSLLLLILSQITFPQTLAVVNGKKISIEFLKQELKKLPLEKQKNYEDDYSELLEDLINQELLIQEAIHQKLDTISEVRTRIEQNDSLRNDILVNELLDKKVRNKINITENEMQNYFKDNPESMKGLTYLKIKPQILRTLTNQKQSKQIMLYVAKLRSKAKIVYNEKLIVEKLKKTNPIESVLKNKLPTMVEFGSCNSALCARMKPIITELQKEYKDKLNILTLGIEEHAALTQKYQILLVPTLIFFDTLGNETSRHTGFFLKDSILIQFQNAGLK